MNSERMPLVTVGIPVYNAGKVLKEAVESVLAQTYSNLEIIIINDGSVDDSSLVLSQFARDGVTIIDDPVNRGLVHRLNQVITMARGEYIVRMDADDVMIYDRIESQVNYMVKHPECDLLAANGIVIDDNGRIGGRIVSRIPNAWREFFISGNPIVHPTVIAKASWCKLNLYDPRFVRCEDAELWMRVWGNSCMNVLDKDVLYYRVSSSRSCRPYLLSKRSARMLYVLTYKGRVSVFVLALAIVRNYISIAMYLAQWAGRDFKLRLLAPGSGARKCQSQ